MNQSRFYDIGGLMIEVIYQSPFLVFDPRGGAVGFEECEKSSQWIINVDHLANIDLSDSHVLFEGVREFQANIPYKWSIHLIDGFRTIFFEFENHHHIKRGTAVIDYDQTTVSINLELLGNEIFPLDPFFHPLGVLVLNEIISDSNGFMIHASGVNDHGNGYLFSAVSGTGKSTMADLWAQKGATVINDDRLIVRSSAGGDFFIYNTPMPYYSDVTKSAPVKACFLLKQATENYIARLTEIQSVLGMMGNCIQHLYSQSRIENHMMLIQNLVQQCDVFEVGFKPDTDIVDLIRQEFGH
ncbi:MAG: hypothetical protein JEZ14_01310 [Marinilabiliaceae bacterium]|nr:hypothetical protein [Marinilabiliaceae bacterium]